MPRVIGIDPGTVSIDLCGLDGERLFLDESWPTADALADPPAFVQRLESAGPLDLIAGPSGYGLPLTSGRELTDDDLRLAFLAPPGGSGGIGGIRALARALAASSLPVVFTPGVIHLPTVPAHRKVNRVDMGTADKVAAAALAIHEQSARRRCDPTETSFILLELGGAFTAAVAVDRGAIVDGIGGSSGPLGVRAGGALDGEVAFLAGSVTKEMIFRGGAATIAGDPAADAHSILASTAPLGRIAWSALIESGAKTVAALLVSVPHAAELIVSGRLARMAAVCDELRERVSAISRLPVHALTGFATSAMQAAQGAALIADGLAGGSARGLVDAMRIREARGTVLDHLFVIDAAAARARLGLSA